MRIRTVHHTTHGQHMIDRLHSRTGTGWTHITDLPAGDKYTRSVSSTTELTITRRRSHDNADRPGPWRWTVVDRGRHTRTGTAGTAHDAMTAAERNVPDKDDTTIPRGRETIR